MTSQNLDFLSNQLKIFEEEKYLQTKFKKGNLYIIIVTYSLLN